jgi:hypothetical protein
VEAAEEEAIRTFPDSSMSTLPPRPRDPPGFYILQARTEALVPKEMMDSSDSATRYLEELFLHETLRQKAWAANGILQMHLDGKVSVFLHPPSYWPRVFCSVCCSGLRPRLLSVPAFTILLLDLFYAVLVPSRQRT